MGPQEQLGTLSRLLLLCSVAAALALPGTSWHQVGPKIYVPFDPNRAQVVAHKVDLFAVVLPSLVYASYPLIAPYGDLIVHDSTANTYGLVTIFLDPPQELAVPETIDGVSREALRNGGKVMAPKSHLFYFTASLRGGPDAIFCWPRQGTQAQLFYAPKAPLAIRELYASTDPPGVVALLTNGELALFPEQSRIPRSLATGVSVAAVTPGWCYFARGGREVWRCSLAGGKPERALGPLPGDVEALAADPLGHRLACVVRSSGQGGRLQVHDLVSGRLIWEVGPVTPPGYAWGRTQVLKLSAHTNRLFYTGQYQGRDGVFFLDLARKTVVDLATELRLEGVLAQRAVDCNETGELLVFATGTDPSRLVLAFLPDETAPEMWIDGLPTMIHPGQLPLEFHIRYRDRAVVSGVDLQTLSVQLNGSQLVAASGREPEQAHFKLTSELLQPGLNELRVKIADRAGNVAEKVLRFEFRLPNQQ